MACVLEAGEGVVDFERVAQCVDALSVVGAISFRRNATESVAGQAAKGMHARR